MSAAGRGMIGRCPCWANNHALGHDGHCCFAHGDRKVNGGWREDDQVCHVAVIR